MVVYIGYAHRAPVLTMLVVANERGLLFLTADEDGDTLITTTC